MQSYYTLKEVGRLHNIFSSTQTNNFKAPTSQSDISKCYQSKIPYKEVLPLDGKCEIYNKYQTDIEF